MAQINIFTGKEETERVYMKPEKARKIIETNKDNLIAIMGLRQQYPDVIDITSHYILVKPNTLTDMAGEAQILCFKTTGKEYAQGFEEKKLDIYSFRRHLHDTIRYNVATPSFVIVHDKENNTLRLHGSRQATLSYRSEYFKELITLMFSLEKQGLDITQILKDINPGDNMAITSKGIRPIDGIIESMEEGEKILSLGTFIFPKEANRSEAYIRAICALPDIKVKISNLNTDAIELVESLLDKSAITL